MGEELEEQTWGKIRKVKGRKRKLYGKKCTSCLQKEMFVLIFRQLFISYVLIPGNKKINAELHFSNLGILKEKCISLRDITHHI